MSAAILTVEVSLLIIRISALRASEGYLANQKAMKIIRKVFFAKFLAASSLLITSLALRLFGLSVLIAIWAAIMLLVVRHFNAETNPS
ncbi:MAG: hypothetical protein Q7N50_06365 [Armatimonadota bacterium]|nr:hypothetical protein [Armatimonadota bacterium]